MRPTAVKLMLILLLAAVACTGVQPTPTEDRSERRATTSAKREATREAEGAVRATTDAAVEATQEASRIAASPPASDGPAPTSPPRPTLPVEPKSNEPSSPTAAPTAVPPTEAPRPQPTPTLTPTATPVRVRISTLAPPATNKPLPTPIPIATQAPLTQDDCKVRRLDRRGGRWSVLGGRHRSWLSGAWTSGGETIPPIAGRSAQC